jgi:hypothetical protein
MVVPILINFKSLCFYFILFSLVGLVNASLDVIIEGQENYYLGDEIFFRYTFVPFNFEGEITYVVGVLCDDNPQSLLNSETIFLEKGVQKRFNYSSGVVGDIYTNSNCTFLVDIISPSQMVFSQSFLISLEDDLPFNLVISKRIFAQGENVTIHYFSPVSDLNIDTKLTFPNGDFEQINLPYSFNANEIGNYNLEVSVGREGYKTLSKIEKFGVIESDAQIQDIDFGDYPRVNPFLDKSIRDKPFSLFDSDSKFNVIIIVFIIIIFFVLIILIVTFLVKRRKKTVELQGELR